MDHINRSFPCLGRFRRKFMCQKNILKLDNSLGEDLRVKSSNQSTVKNIFHELFICIKAGNKEIIVISNQPGIIIISTNG